MNATHGSCEAEVRRLTHAEVVLLRRLWACNPGQQLELDRQTWGRCCSCQQFVQVTDGATLAG